MRLVAASGRREAAAIRTWVARPGKVARVPVHVGGSDSPEERFEHQVTDV
jgi:hypothetical protein